MTMNMNDNQLKTGKTCISKTRVFMSFMFEKSVHFVVGQLDGLLVIRRFHGWVT